MIRELNRSKEEWAQLKGHVWVAWTVFNPHGPTLNCIGACPRQDDNSYEIFYRWMHMLGGRIYVIGHVAANDAISVNDTFLRDMLDAFETPVLPGHLSYPMISGVPSCISLGQTPHEQTLLLLDLFKRAPAIRSADWGRQRYYLLKYKLDLFGRAGEEAREGYEAACRNPENYTKQGVEYLSAMRARYEVIPSFLNWQPNAYQSHAYEEQEFEDWWGGVTSKIYLEAGLAQFAQARVGAAYMSGGIVSGR